MTFIKMALSLRYTTLRNVNYDDLEERLVRFSKKRPMALVIPSLYSELHGKALPNIVDKIKEIPYLNEVVIGLDRANKEQFEDARRYFDKLPQNHRILWHDGPRLRKMDQQLKRSPNRSQPDGQRT
ncbi:MAG: hypothetical protein U5L09_02470 [Bacteroidales bacterium]|nr:hypothetical protein [Bacteroidales bacterium]